MFIALLLACGAANAHLLNMTKVIVNVDGDGQVTVDMQIDLSRAVGGPLDYYRVSRIEKPLENRELSEVFSKLTAAFVLQLGGERVALQVVSATLPQLPEADFVNPLSWPMTTLKLRGQLPLHGDAKQLQGVFQSSFRFEEPIALTIAQAGRTQTRWLVANQASPVFELNMGGAMTAAEPSDNNTVWQYLKFGFLHILPGGLDHVLFVLGLCFGSRSVLSLWVLVTSFTLAHSLTLALATLGLVRLPAQIVEPLIAASIVWVGVENCFVRNASRHRPALVFCFGLLHGLGFAGALAELDLPQTNFLLALLSFNVGIELGQLAVIAIATAVTLRFMHRTWYDSRIRIPASLGIALTASAWTVARMGSNLIL